uniref:Uncharacterized protein n=1 Tax=Ascaris lumbricoides TaxID=6252 RepID=A0A0M3I4L6_ASCLU
MFHSLPVPCPTYQSAGTPELLQHLAAKEKPATHAPIHTEGDHSVSRRKSKPENGKIFYQMDYSSSCVGSVQRSIFTNFSRKICSSTGSTFVKILPSSLLGLPEIKNAKYSRLHGQMLFTYSSAEKNRGLTMLKSSAQYLVLIAIFVDVVAAFSSTVVETTGVQSAPADAQTYYYNYGVGNQYPGVGYGYQPGGFYYGRYGGGMNKNYGGIRIGSIRTETIQL